jgi:hypothetical protein
MKKMELPAPLALPEELEIMEIEMIDDVFTMTAHSTRKYPCCPLCGTPAQRFHSHYLRRITDLPSGGKGCTGYLGYPFQKQEVKQSSRNLSHHLSDM